MSKPTLPELLKAIVAIPSITGHAEACQQVIDWSARQLREAGVAQVTVGQVNGVPHLTASTREPNKDMIWFVCHLDVVPGGEALFALRQDEKNYYGRGVFDMKGMFIGALAALFDIPDVTKTNIGFMLTTDEEVGGKNGVGALATKDFKGAAVFVFDQSDHWVLMKSMKGVLWLRFTAEGKAAHGARPWLGHNANVELINYLQKFSDWFYTNIPQKHPEHYFTTYNLGTMQGGEATNQVPGEAVANADIRFVSEDEATKVIQAAQDLAEGTKVKVEVLMHEPSVMTDPNSPWQKRTAQAMDELGIKPTPGKGEAFGHGSTDGRYFAPLNIPVVTVRPPGGGQHSDDEWASRQGLAEMQKLCHTLILATKDNTPNKPNTT
jgi:succinyl-diaminopimelate desuccinylase